MYKKRTTALKTTMDEYDSISKDDVRSKHIKFDPAEIVLPDDWYAQNTQYASRDEMKKDLGQSQVDIIERRQASNRFYGDSEQVDFENMSDVQKRALSDMYGKDTKNLDIYRKGGKFYVDQKYNITGEAGVANPIELTDPAFTTSEATKEAASEAAPSQPEIGSTNIMELFNVNPETGGNLTEAAKSFYDTSYSKDNPVLDVLQDEKWMRKARKEYNKTIAKPDAFGRTSEDRMPFERWVMNMYKPKGQDRPLHNAAKSWERINKDDGNRELKGGSKGVVESMRSPSNPFDRYKEMQREGGEATVTNKLKYTNPNHMLNKRTMSFRKKR
jgi:hypothetical protein|tara:strand:+ start:277 stop:1263 length:987 start_codon:yes stop_codon:yes gene_type:complete